MRAIASFITAGIAVLALAAPAQAASKPEPFCPAYITKNGSCQSVANSRTSSAHHSDMCRSGYRTSGAPWMGPYGNHGECVVHFKSR